MVTLIPSSTAVGGFENHPAVIAWRRGPALGRPSRVDTLQETAERSVYRLAGVETASGTAIAKRSATGTLDVEQLVYDEILPGIGLPALQCLGLHPDAAGDGDWLFVEVAEGERLRPSRDDHRVLAGEWLGRLHQYQPPAAAAARLRQREPIPYHEYIARARDEFSRYLATGSATLPEMAVITALSAQFERIDGLHSRIAELRANLPRVVLHGDFTGRNAHVATRRDRLTLLAFDWQDAGWGTPEMDLAQAPLPSDGFAGNPAVESYWLAAREAWPGLDRTSVRGIANLGTLFRCLLALSWDAPGLGRWGPRVVERLRYYHEALAIVLRADQWEQ